MGDDTGSDQRRERTQDRARRTHARLLHAAALEISRVGYENASIPMICREAGVTPGALYNHFGSKWALAQEILDDHRVHVEAVAEHVRKMLPSAFERAVRFSADLAELIAHDACAQASIQLSLEPALPVRTAAWREWTHLADDLIGSAPTEAHLRPAAHSLGSLSIVMLLSAWLLSRAEEEPTFEELVRTIWTTLASGAIDTDGAASAMETVKTIFGR